MDTNPGRRIKRIPAKGRWKQNNKKKVGGGGKEGKVKKKKRENWRRDNPADGWIKWKSNDFRLHAQGIVRIASIVLFNPSPPHPTRSPTSTISSILKFIIFIAYTHRFVHFSLSFLLLLLVVVVVAGVVQFGCRRAAVDVSLKVGRLIEAKNGRP